MRRKDRGAIPAGRLRWSGNAGLLLLLAAGHALLAAGLARLRAATPDLPLVVTQVPRETTAPKHWNPRGFSRADWFAGARIVLVSPGGTVRVLSEGFASACDPNLSFDARQLVFAGKREPQSKWRIWQVDIDGKNARVISPEDQEARSPIYATTLFTLDSPEPWFTVVYAAREDSLSEAGAAGGCGLYNVKLDGTERRRLTYNPNHHFDPFQMWDGRLLYAAERYPLEPGGAGHVGLYGVHIVGTDMVLYGGNGGKRIQHMPCATEAGLVVFVENDQPVWDGAGQLACVTQQRPHRSYRPLTGDPAWVYLYPSPLGGNQVLVSRRPADLREPWQVYRFDADTGRCEPVFGEPAYHSVQARVAQPRPRPDGHSTIVEPARFTTGVFYGLNCYDAGQEMLPHLFKGLFKRMRVIEGTPAGAGQAVSGEESRGPVLSDRKGPFVSRRLLGEAPIESDGSFNLEVPADTPILLQPLDAQGVAVASCGWLWVKPRETRGCVGCHEDPELIPENNFVLALRRLPTRLNPPPDLRRSVTFRENIVPILKNRCASVECHGMPGSPLYLPVGAEAPTHQDLQQAYTALLAAVEGGPGTPSPLSRRGKYVDTGRARTSYLVWRLFGTNTSRPWDSASGQPGVASRKLKPMPPPDTGGALAEEELRAFVEWIDLGAAWESPGEPRGQTASSAPTNKEPK